MIPNDDTNQAEQLRQPCYSQQAILCKENRSKIRAFVLPGTVSLIYQQEVQNKNEYLIQR